MKVWTQPDWVLLSLSLPLSHSLSVSLSLTHSSSLYRLLACVQCGGHWATEEAGQRLRSRQWQWRQETVCNWGTDKCVYLGCTCLCNHVFNCLHARFLCLSCWIFLLLYSCQTSSSPASGLKKVTFKTYLVAPYLPYRYFGKGNIDLSLTDFYFSTSLPSLLVSLYL